jgi:hypothetical protein
MDYDIPPPPPAPPLPGGAAAPASAAPVQSQPNGDISQQQADAPLPAWTTAWSLHDLRRSTPRWSLASDAGVRELSEPLIRDIHGLFTSFSLLPTQLSVSVSGTTTTSVSRTWTLIKI